MINIILGGNKMKNLKEIINYEDCEKRTKKSKYFTEIFFEKYPVKYRELLEKYEWVPFLDNVVCIIDKKYVNKEYLLCVGGQKGKDNFFYPYSLDLENDLIEENYNEIIDFIEEIDEEARNHEDRIETLKKEIERKEINKEEIQSAYREIENAEEKILSLQDILLASPLNVENYIPLTSYDYAILLFNKTTGGIDYFAKDDYVGTFEIAGSFDEFIENLYVKDDEGKNYQDLIQAREVRKAIEDAVEAENEE